MNYHLISSIIKGVWAIDSEAALGYAPLLNNIFGNSSVAFEFDKESFIPFAVSGTQQYKKYDGGWNSAPENSIAVIPLTGPLMKNDQYCGPVGMATIGEIIKEADKAHNISGIILKIDSPGGTVDGTKTLADIISQTSKPVIAFADGLMASAALWLGSSADETIAADSKTQIGSIGVLLSFADMQPAYEKLGVKFHQVTADQSSEKTKYWDELRAGNYDNYKKEVLNPLAEDFINHIKQTQPEVKPEQLTGKIFFAQDVIGSLVDHIGNFDFAVNRMNELIEQNQIKPKQQKQMKKFEAINKALGIDELASTEDGVFLNEEQLAVIDGLLSGIDQNKTELTQLKTDLEKAQADLQTANDTKAQLEADLKELRKKPGAETAKVITEKETATDEKSKDGNVVSENKSFIDNLSAVAEEFGV